MNKTDNLQKLMIQARIITSEKSYSQSWKDLENYFKSGGPVSEEEIPKKLDEITNVIKELNQAIKKEKQPQGSKQAGLKETIGKILSKIKGPLASVLFTVLSAAAQEGKTYDFEKSLIELLEESGVDSAYIANVKGITKGLEDMFKQIDAANLELDSIKIPDVLVPKPKQKKLVPRKREKSNVGKIAEGIILDSIMLKDAKDVKPGTTKDVTEAEVKAYAKRLHNRFEKIEKQVEMITKKDGKIDSIMKNKDFNKAAEELVHFENGWEEGFKFFKV